MDAAQSTRVDSRSTSFLDATSITTTGVMARNSSKMLMAALALAGITGVYLRQVTKIGVLGLLGYVLFAAGYLSMLGTEYVAALVLPSIAHSATAYVNDVIAMELFFVAGDSDAPEQEDAAEQGGPVNAPPTISKHDDAVVIRNRTWAAT